MRERLEMIAKQCGGPPFWSSCSHVARQVTVRKHVPFNIASISLNFQIATGTRQENSSARYVVFFAAWKMDFQTFYDDMPVRLRRIV